VFHPYLLVRPGRIEPGQLDAIVRGYGGEFKQVRAALLMTLASDLEAAGATHFNVPVGTIG
jgi:hypothetical protein